FAIEVAEAVIGVGIILISEDARYASGAGVPPGSAVSMGESIGGQELQPLAQPFGEARVQPVVPPPRGRINIIEPRRRETSKWHALANIRKGINRFPADRVGGAGQQRLVGRPVLDLVCAARADVANFKQEVMPQLRL